VNRFEFTRLALLSSQADVKAPQARVTWGSG
jgi:hypothetical protein